LWSYPVSESSLLSDKRCHVLVVFVKGAQVVTIPGICLCLVRTGLDESGRLKWGHDVLVFPFTGGVEWSQVHCSSGGPIPFGHHMHSGAPSSRCANLHFFNYSQCYVLCQHVDISSRQCIGTVAAVLAATGVAVSSTWILMGSVFIIGKR
jgi:hypothetical protein